MKAGPELDKVAILKSKLTAALDIIINPHEFERADVLSWVKEVEIALKAVGVEV